MGRTDGRIGGGKKNARVVFLVHDTSAQCQNARVVFLVHDTSSQYDACTGKVS